MMALFPTEQNSKWHKAGFHFSPSEVEGWRSPQKPEGPSGRRCEDWTRRKELLFPDAGIVVRDRRIPPDTRLAGSTPCLIVGVHRDQHLALDMVALIRGFRTPARCGRSCVVRGRRSKASQGGNRGQEGAPVWSGATYGDFRISDGSRVSRREPVARNLGGGNDDDERVRSRGCAALARARRSGGLTTSRGRRPPAGSSSFCLAQTVRLRTPHLRRSGDGHKLI